MVEQQTLRVSPFPALRLRHTLPAKQQETLPFPFNSSSLRYYYLGRNGLFSLTQLWNLRDQEVLMPAYSHGVETDTLLKAGVNLRFYRVDCNMQVSVDDVVSQLTPYTRAVYMIHYLGFPGPVEEISEICHSLGIPLIEDCALALLSRLGDRPLGSFGDAAIFSIYKTLPVPNGGGLIIRNTHLTPDLESTRPSWTSTLALTASAVWRDLEFEGGFVHNLLRQARRSVKSVSRKIGVVPVGSEAFDESAVTLSMSRLSHWILAHQDYPAIVEKRRRNYLQLLARLHKISPPVFFGLPDGVCPLFYPLRVRNKLKVAKHLFERGVDSVNFWSTSPPVPPVGEFPEAETLRRTILEIPCHQDLTPKEIDSIADCVCDVHWMSPLW
jgi:dTDP-4-amino-4,6-dideoxygalactose transaminase